MVRWLGLDKYQKMEFRDSVIPEDDLPEKKMKTNSDFSTTTEKDALCFHPKEEFCRSKPCSAFVKKEAEIEFCSPRTSH